MKTDRKVAAALVLASVMTALFGFAPAARSAPKIVPDAPAYDFGTVDETEVVQHLFTLRNEGDLPLEIRKVETSCGCTATQVGGNQIQPGSSTPLTAKINLRGRRGRQEKTITVSTNDPAQPALVLKLSGMVTAEVEVSPVRVDFLDLKPDQVAERIITITALAGPPLQITGVDARSAAFVTARSVPLEEGKSYQIRMQSNPPFNPGVNRGMVTVSTSNPKYPIIYLPVSLTVSSDLVVVPNAVMLPYGSGDNPPVNVKLLVRSRSGKAFQVVRTQGPSAEIVVRVLPDSPSSWKVEVDNLVPSPGINGTVLRVFTEGTDTPELRVPIQLFSRGPVAPQPVVKPAAAVRP